MDTKNCAYLYHLLCIIDNLLSTLLYLGDGDIPAVHWVDVCDHGREAGLVLNTRRGVDDIGADDDGRILRIREDGDRTGLRNGVDASELDVDPEAEFTIAAGKNTEGTYLSMTFA